MKPAKLGAMLQGLWPVSFTALEGESKVASGMKYTSGSSKFFEKSPKRSGSLPAGKILPVLPGSCGPAGREVRGNLHQKGCTIWKLIKGEWLKKVRVDR